jgi:N-acetyl-gamma-glutamyl-phosphate reductase
MDAATVGEQKLAEMHPRLRGRCDLVTFSPDPQRMAALELDTVFLCTPDQVSNDLAPGILSRGIRVIDLSAAYRLRDSAAYPNSYGFDHAAPELLPEAVYGLPEWKGEAVAAAKLIANPGCYPTSVLLALLPLIQAGFIETESDIFCDSKSGVTGAGRSAKQATLFAEVANNFRPYSPIVHRHAPEMCQEMDWSPDRLIFIPHLLPTNRGILSTIYIRFRQPAGSEEIDEVYRRRYSKCPFVRILGGSLLPELRAVNHTNFCDIAWRSAGDGSRAVIFSAIDNLVKGASGQAVQNFNLMHGLDETAGLQ